MLRHRSVLPRAVVRTIERRNYHQYYSALFIALYQYGSSSSLSHKPRSRPFASTLLLLHFYSSSSSSLLVEKETSSTDDTLVLAVKSNIKSVEEYADHEAVRFSFLFFFVVCSRDMFSS